MGTVAERILAKVTRAEQHILDFKLAQAAFEKTDPYAVRADEYPHFGYRCYSVSKLADIPDPLTAIAADVIQNLRSPIDQIAYQLVKAANGGAEPDWNVYYPIAGSAAYYPSARGGIAKHVRQEVIDAIDATEPYKGGKGEALWLLNKLNNPDKHHLLIGAVSVASSVDIPAIRDWMSSFPGVLMGAPESIATPKAPSGLKVGDIIYRESLKIPGPVHYKREFTFDVAFNQPGVIENEPALKTLLDLKNFVKKTLTILTKLLP